MKKRGWHGQSYRHSLAARGIKTKYKPRYFNEKTASGVRMEDTIDVGDDGEVSLQGSTAIGFVRAEQPKTERMETENLFDGVGAFASANPEDLIRGADKPQTIETRMRAERRIRDTIRSDITGRRPVQSALSLVERGQPEVAIEYLTNETFATENQYRALREEFKRAGMDVDSQEVQQQIESQIRGLTTSEKQALQSALNAYSIQRAQAGLPIDQKVLENIDKNVLEQVARIKQSRGDWNAEQAKSVLRRKFEQQVLPGAVVEAIDTPVEGVKALLGPADQKWNGLIGRIDDGISGNKRDLADSPFVTENVSAKNEEGVGLFNPLPGGVPNLSSNFDFVGAGEGTNPVFKPLNPGFNQKTINQQVDKQIKSLKQSKNDFTKVDLSSFEKGNEAFEAGDRESLLSAITDLKGQEAILQDRFQLVEMVRQNTVSMQSLASSFENQDDNIITGMLPGTGANKLSKQVRDVNEVRSAIVDSANKAHGRRRMLEYRLQRLDSVVPPETDVPQNVKRFKPSKGFENPLLNANNITIQAIQERK